MKKLLHAEVPLQSPLDCGGRVALPLGCRCALIWLLRFQFPLSAPFCKFNKNIDDSAKGA